MERTEISKDSTSTEMAIPEAKYGVRLQDSSLSQEEENIAQIRRLGYAVVDSGLSETHLDELSEVFDNVRSNYIKKWGEDRLRKLKEYHTIRAPISFGNPWFLKIATNSNLINIIDKVIMGRYILNQQNGIVNPPNESYSQAAWHRDLPYQHYVSTTPLAINALFCLDDFTLENGATYVLPATHKEINCPTNHYIKSNAIQVRAKRGSYIVLDCMLYHSGGLNRTKKERRAINHVFTIPYFKQQINLKKCLANLNLTQEEEELLGFKYQEPNSVEEYFGR